MPIWLLVLIIVAGAAVLAYILLVPHRPPSGQKGPQILEDDSEQEIYIPLNPRRPQDNNRPHQPSNRKK